MIIIIQYDVQCRNIHVKLQMTNNNTNNNLKKYLKP